MGEEYGNELDGGGRPGGRQQSAPRAIATPNAVAESASGSPHWPRSYERTMEVYSRSRSLSRRSRSLRADSFKNSNGLRADCFKNSNGLRADSFNYSNGLLEPSLSEQFGAAVDSLAEADLKTPLLLPEENAADLESQPKGLQLHEDEELHVQPGSSFLQSLFNGMNILAGVGILSTPYAAANGGWLGLCLLVLIAMVMCYTGILLRRCLDSSAYISSYPDIGEAAFGRRGRWIISIMLYLELYAVSIEFLILEGDNLAQLFPSASVGVLGAEQVFVVCAALCMLPTVWLRDLRWLSYLSAGGVFASLAVVLAVGWVGVVDGVGFHHRGSLVHLHGLPLAIGLFSFCYCGHSVFPTVYSSMQDRTQFSSVLIICFVLCTFMYGGVAIMGYAMFGDELQSQITLNLPRELPASMVAIWVTLISPFAKYALTLMPLAVALEEFLPHTSSKGHVLGGTIVRTGLVASTVIVALTVPFFGLLMAFIGSFLSVAVSMHVPCICYLRMYKGHVSRLETCFIVFIIFLGSLAGGIGTYFSVKEILTSS